MTQSNLIRSPGLGRAVIASAVIFGAVLAAPSAMACTLGNWSDTNGSVVANNPFGDDGDPDTDSTNVARYSGACGARMDGQGYVQDNNPGGISRIVARFYVLNELGGSTTIYEGYSATDGTGALFTVEMDAAGDVTLTDVASGSSVTQNSSTDWASVEIDFGQSAGDGFISLSVNGQTAVEDTELSNSGDGIQSVRMGNLDGATGALNFDAYESRRSTAVGRLMRADANNDEAVSSPDLAVLVNELSGSSLASGQPDCNEDGTVNSQDISCLVDLLLQ